MDEVLAVGDASFQKSAGKMKDVSEGGRTVYLSVITWLCLPGYERGILPETGSKCEGGCHECRIRDLFSCRCVNQKIDREMIN